jgi:hypothetical protein
MTASTIKELYVSANGDRWSLGMDQAGKLLVCHHPNKPSGGQPSEIAVDVFLSHGGQGPEHQALTEALATLDIPREDWSGQKPAAQTSELEGALGQAVARCWSALTPETQHTLFEAAVLSAGEAIRQELALYLHGKHQRTAGGVQARAITEPDSLGG